MTETDNETYHLMKRPAVSYTDKPFFEYLHGQVQVLLLHFLPPLDHFENSNCTAQVPAEFQHFLVRGLVVFAVFSGLHLLEPASEGDVGVVGVSEAGRPLRPHQRDQRVLLPAHTHANTDGCSHTQRTRPAQLGQARNDELTNRHNANLFNFH